MGEEESEYAFASHDEVIAAVHMMEESVFENIPKFMWIAQREQLRTAVRNHFDELGCDSSDPTLLRGALYGAMLAINLESQSSVVSLQTVMLATVLLDMFENPADAIGTQSLEDLRNMIEDATKRQRPSKMKYILRRIVGALTA